MKVEDDKMKLEQINGIQTSTPQKKLYEEFSNFLKKHSVYETIPENMKVLFISFK